MQVYARYDARAAHIESVGTMFNGTEEVGSGSGLLLGDQFVVTNNHVIPRENNYRTLVINVRLKSRAVGPLQVVAVHRDPDRDLALVELSGAVAGAAGPRCPMPTILRAASAPPGTELFVLGFPVNQELAIANGLVSNHSGARGRWLTNTLLNPGNSGGPAFDENGALVGIAVGGITGFDSGGGSSVPVTGVNFIIPTMQLVQSPLFAKLTRLPDDRRCWKSEELLVSTMTAAPATTVQPGSGGGGGGGSSSSRPPSFPLPDRINRTFTISETKDDHPVVLAPHAKNYERRFNAEPGYRITACNIAAATANKSQDVTCNIDAGRTSAAFRFRLESGPAIDRWRGWWGGTVTLQQQRIPQ